MTGKRNPGPFESAVARASARIRLAQHEHRLFATFDEWWATYYRGVTGPVPPAGVEEVARNAWNGARARVTELERALAAMTADRDGIQSRLNERLKLCEESYQELSRENERLREGERR